MDDNGTDDSKATRRLEWRPPGWSLVLGAAVVVAGVSLGAFALGQSGAAAAPRASRASATAGVSRSATVTVTGSGSVEGTPDTVSFQVGVQSQAVSATSAIADNNSRMRSLETSLGTHGVANSGMQTSNLSINEDTNDHGVFTGFTVDDDLNVTMHDVAKAGEAIEAAATAAGNGIQLYGISFSISNRSALLASARKKAMGNAHLEANQLAHGAGAVLGQVLKVNVSTDYQTQPDVGEDLALAAGASIPVKSGSQPVSVQVTVTYALDR